MAKASDFYCPNHGSIACQVCEFFLRNPGEDLSVEDILVKYSPLGSYSDVNQALRDCVRFEFLAKSVRSGKHPRPISHYSAGPLLATAFAERRAARNAKVTREAARLIAKVDGGMASGLNRPSAPGAGHDARLAFEQSVGELHAVFEKCITAALVAALQGPPTVEQMRAYVATRFKQ